MLDRHQVVSVNKKQTLAHPTFFGRRSIGQVRLHGPGFQGNTNRLDIFFFGIFSISIDLVPLFRLFSLFNLGIPNCDQRVKEVERGDP